jgi:proteasome lid subunit RPN8/RPN11
MAQEAIAAYPEECCGILIGRLRKRRPWLAEVQESIAAENRAGANRQQRYTIDPVFLIQVQREARRAELDVVGYYHSHPDRPAVPSRIDLETAWPDFAYVILAVEADQAVDMKCWRLRLGGGSFEELDFGYP